MRKSAIRLVVLLGVIAIIGIISIQVYFFQIAFNNEERNLNRKIQVALWDVVEQIYELNNINYVGKNPVYQYSPDYFVVNVNDFINTEVLEHYLVKTFEKQDIALDFEYAIYDCQNDEMLYGKYVNLSNKENKPSKIALPKHDDFIYYFGIYFPWRKQFLLGNINSIYFLSGILIFVVLFLGYALIFILKQRRFSELQKDVVNNLTHEFKTPLSSILLSTNVLSDKEIVNEPERFVKYLQIINNQANSLLRHIEQVLGINEIESIGRLKKKNLSVSEFLINLKETINSRVEDKQGSFLVDLKTENCFICADEFHFTNVIYNLVDNSLKYCALNPKMVLSSEIVKKQVCITLKDNGIGMDRKYHHKIFKKFYRIPTGNVHNVKGFGIGLSYVKDILNRHKWKYKINSNLNEGTSFSIYIPLNNTDCE